ncbi:lrr receptor-like serine/threonine-protein kinase ios1 [Quercus suber]|uniref:Lrr receptor-like serine/threonine-protein kinase ios1 n=1 Tax=Quercus suber TaxID=58331 RepID=A0AAW0KGK0_QUESU
MGLVYEYMANGNLALHLSDKNASFLSWETRLRIAMDSAQGRPAISINPEKVHLINWVSSMLEIGDVKNIVDPRLDGDPDINSVWKAIEVAMICVSPTSIEWPTMTYVVMELKQCLAMELARGHEGFETNSNQINGINYVHTGQTPLAR